MSLCRALISVSDKNGIIEFAEILHRCCGAELVATGGTAAVLKAAGLPVVDVAEITRFPEMLEGRVKTLHPYIHAGILNRRDNIADRRQIENLGIDNIDFVVVNLYPFGEIANQPQTSWDEAIEHIDIGGTALLRSAAKNHQYVTVICDPSDYKTLATMLNDSGEISLHERRRLALKAFRHTSSYDAQIAMWLAEQHTEESSTFPTELTVEMKRIEDLRYGENPHQKAALYGSQMPSYPSMLSIQKLSGKELSYNNYNDGNAALELLMEFTEPVAIAIKHTNPCAVAIGNTAAEAFSRCYAADPISIFGGIVAINRTVDKECALMMKDIFLDMLIAPSFTTEALHILKRKRNLIILELDRMRSCSNQSELHLRSIRGGLLLQEANNLIGDPQQWNVVSKNHPSEVHKNDAAFGWKIVKHMRSNAIAVVKDGQTLGMGIGQVNRVDAARIALNQAGASTQNAVLISDAMLPFADVVLEAAQNGISLIVQTGGSVRDSEVIKAADDHGIAMIFTSIRHFKH